jgi:arylsulfatase A-like enzyme
MGIRLPGIKGTIIGDRVAMIDLFPTVLDLLGIKFSEKVSGHSLIPLMFLGAKYPFPIFADMPKYPNFPEDIIMMIKGDYKIIYNRTKRTWELYDLKKDSGEMENIFFQSDIAEAYKSELLKWFTYMTRNQSRSD